MKRWKVLAALGACSVVLVLAQQPAHDAISRLPHFEKSGSTSMLVHARPYLMLATANSSASSPAYMKPVWDKLAWLNLNTVIGTASWELVEPIEGQFDFTAVHVQARSAAGARDAPRADLVWNLEERQFQLNTSLCVKRNVSCVSQC